MAKQYAFELESGLASKRLTDAKFIKGGYLVVDKRSDLTNTDNYPVETKDKDGNITADGIIVPGSLAFVKEENKFYQYNSTNGWVIKNFEGETTGTNIFSSEGSVSSKTNTNLVTKLYVWSDSSDSLHIDADIYESGTDCSVIYAGEGSKNATKLLSKFYIWESSGGKVHIEY